MKSTPNSLPVGLLARSRSALTLGLLAAFSLGAQVRALTIDFSTAPRFDQLLPYSEKGFTFTLRSGYAYTQGDRGSGLPTELQLEDGAVVRLERTDKGLFDLLGLQVTLNRSGGRSPYDPAGLLTSAGGTSGISAPRPYTFSGVNYQELNWVEMVFVGSTEHHADFRIDNIVVQNSVATRVPDTGSPGLLLTAAVGVLGLCLQRFRRS